MSAPPFTPATTPPPTEQPPEPSLESLLLRFGLVTLDQLGSALREQAETGTPFADLLVRDGVLGADDLARVLEKTPEPEPAPVAAAPKPVPAPVPEPELPPAAEAEPVPPPAPVAVPEPEPVAVAPAPEPEPAPQQVVGFAVRGRLVNGEEIEIASVADATEAQRIALDAMRACARTDTADWPILSGRYVRPEAIVSIEVVESLA